MRVMCAGGTCAQYRSATLLPKKELQMLWVLLGILYIVLLVVLGVTTLRKGHWVMFIVGIFFPLMWIIGAVIPPTGRAARAV
jgi:hypothetical protein